MGYMLLQCRDAVTRARVDREYHLQVPHRWCDRAEQIIEAGKTSDCQALVVDVAESAGRSTASAVRQVRQARPDISVLLWCKRTDIRRPEFLEVLEAAGCMLFQEPGATEEQILSQFIPRSRFPYREAVEQAIERRVPEEDRQIVQVSLEPGNQGLTVPELASKLRMAQRTLAHRLRQRHLPPAGELLLWGRILGASWDLSSSGQSIERIADRHGFASPGSLRDTLKKWTTDVPRDLRDTHSFGWVLRCFEHELSRQQRRALSS